MDLPAPRFVAAHGVLGLPQTLPPQPDIDEQLIKHLQGEFANVVNRQLPIPNMPPNVPRLVLTSTSAQFIMSSIQADFEVRFYGDFLTDRKLCLDYVRRKMQAVVTALGAVGSPPSTVGLIATLQFSTKGVLDKPAEHVVDSHLKIKVDNEAVQDAHARVAVKVRDTYYVNLTVSNFESRIIQRPVLAVGGPIAVRPWEGDVDDFGLELTVDINNGLEGRVKQADAEVTENGIDAVVGLLEKVSFEAGPQFVGQGEVNVADLVEEPA